MITSDRKRQSTAQGAAKMDGATTTRKYPSYTTADLEAFVASGQGNAVMVQEIADRKANVSVVKATPQLIGGNVQVKIGRM
jgi:hypothetical protein